MEQKCNHSWCIENPSIPVLALMPTTSVEAICEHCGERRMLKTTTVKLGLSLHILFEEEGRG